MRVLLIEDDGLVRAILAEALIGEGIELDGLSNAEDALILLGAGQVPDVLVTDIDPGHGPSGHDLVDIARARHPAVGVILISGRAPASIRPGERFLHKPFAAEDLVLAILSMAGRRPGSSMADRPGAGDAARCAGNPGPRPDVS